MTRASRALVLATLALLLVTACGSSDDGGGGSKTVKLTFWTHTHPPMIELNKKLISEYEAKHPNVKIAYEQIPNTEFATKMLTALSNGSGPDVINMDDVALRGDYIPKGLLAPMDPAAAAKAEAGYVPGTLDGAKGADGKLYGLPTEFNATAFAINKKHFADAGLDPGQAAGDVGRGGRDGQEARRRRPRGVQLRLPALGLVHAAAADAAQRDRRLDPHARRQELGARPAAERAGAADLERPDPQGQGRKRRHRVARGDRAVRRLRVRAALDDDDLPVGRGAAEGRQPRRVQADAGRAAAAGRRGQADRALVRLLHGGQQGLQAAGRGVEVHRLRDVASTTVG